MQSKNATRGGHEKGYSLMVSSVGGWWIGWETRRLRNSAPETKCTKVVSRQK